MTSTVAPSAGHPIADFTARLGHVLDELAEVPAWSLTAHEQRAVLVELARQRARVEELWLRVLAAGDRNDIAATVAATSTAAWLAHETRRPAPAAHAKVAATLDDSLVATRAALARGAVDGEQARVIVRAVHTLPADAVEEEPGLPARAEAHLLELADQYDAVRLKHLARHLLHVLDPDAADERLGRRLEVEERTVARATYLDLHDNGDGTSAGRPAGSRSPHQAVMLRRALEAITNPAVAGRADASGGPARRDAPVARRAPNGSVRPSAS